MGTELTVPALFVVAIAVATLGAISIWLRVTEVVGSERNKMARKPTSLFWGWQLIKFLISAGAIWLALTILGILWK